MNKLAIIILTMFLTVSGFQIIGAETDHQINELLTIEQSFIQPIFVNDHEYIDVKIEGISDYIEEPGSPRLPVYKKVVNFPGEVQILDIQCSFYEETHYELAKKIIPASQTRYTIISNTNINDVELVENIEIYSQDLQYPTSSFDYRIRCGLDAYGNPTTFVCIESYPIRYNPSSDTLTSFSIIQIDIEYEPNIPVGESTATDSYDLVIIAPDEFVEELQPLVSHKIAMGMSTIIKTTEAIYNEYQGRDEPEQIKYFVLDAKENWDTSYILLFGGLTSYLYAKDKDDQNHGADNWHVPVRYTNIQEADEVGCISDLYYSDLYRYNEELGEWEFEDWDSSGDNIFARFSFTNRDILDLVPDIHVGRLPCRNLYELRIIRDKIINYESTSPSEKPWFRKIIGITGKNFDMWKDQPDGEYLVDRAFENMSRWIDEEVRVYASNVQSGQGPIPDPEGIIGEFSKGAGFVDFEGHGSPIRWNTIHADGEYETHDWVGGCGVPDIFDFANGDKTPVVMVGGCHNALFNLTIFRVLLTRANHPNYYWTYMPSPFCFNWAMVIKPNGGAIASIGASGYGPASGGDPITLQGEIDNNFFYTLGLETTEKLGEAQTGMITKYVTENNMRQRETFTATITTLLGDPSLQLGGYE